MEKSKIILSLIYKFTERFAVKGLGFIISIVLARLLAPEMFGQVALLTVFTELSLIVIEGGLNTALVQSKQADDRDYSTVFYITLLLSVVMIALLQLIAPYIANYYGSIALTGPLRFYSFSLLLSSFNSIQVAKMQREMRFKEMMFCNLSATIISGIVGIIMAYRGFGLWALVIYYFAQIAISSLAMLFTLRWFPRSRFSMESARRLYGFGIKMLISSVISTLYANIRPLIIGRKFSTAALGYYDRGYRFSSTISLNLDTAVQSVMFPVLSKAQDDIPQFKAMLRRTKQLSSFVVFPAMLGMAAVAEPMVRLLLNEEWLPSVIFVQILCIAEMQVPITASNLLTLKSLGRSDIYAKQEVLRRILMLIVLVISVLAFDSVVAIAVGFMISAWIDAAFTSLPVKKLLGYSLKNQAKDLWKTAFAALVMALAVYAFGLIQMPLFIKLMLQIALGAAVYAFVNLLIKNESFSYISNVLRKKRKA